MKFGLIEAHILTRIEAVSASKSFTRSDVGTFQHCSNTAAIVLTVETDATTPLPVGCEITVHQESTGQITINAATGCFIRRQGSTATTGHTLVGQYSVVVLKKVAANEWRAYGGLTWTT